jgi:hypothetical protein
MSTLRVWALPQKEKRFADSALAAYAAYNVKVPVGTPRWSGRPGRGGEGVEIYIHRSGRERMQLQEVDGSTTVAEAVGLNDGEAVWLEDAEEPLDATRTVAEAVGERGHVHVHRCRRVEVKVTFNGVTKDHSFAPGAKIKRVFRWATGKDGFPMSEEDRAEHALQLCGTDDQPDPADHVGSFVTEGNCEVCFDLVPKHRFEG